MQSYDTSNTIRERVEVLILSIDVEGQHDS